MKKECGKRMANCTICIYPFNCFNYRWLRLFLAGLDWRDCGIWCEFGRNLLGRNPIHAYKLENANHYKAFIVSQTNQIKMRMPLVVDVDGSLLKTDLLLESFWAALGRHPVLCLLTVLRFALNRPMLKMKLADLAALNIEILPIRGEIIDLIEKARSDGREVVLASGSHISMVESLSERVGLRTRAFGTDGPVNLTGHHKAAALVTRFGEGGYAYIGDSAVDIPVWQAGAGGYVVAARGRLMRKIVAAGVKVHQIGGRGKRLSLLKSMRPHQWVKNILLLLPLLAAHRTDAMGFALAAWGIAVFSAAASSIYIVNDLMDLEADRQHETKRNRPFASGEAGILAGMGLSAGLGIAALVGASLLSWQMAAIVALYMGLSLSYSMGLKRLRWVDIAMLAALYTLRVVAGSVAVGVAMSGWLGAFIFPIFFALGGVKRLIELGKTHDEAPLPGRGYARRDRADVRNISITASVGALVIYMLYTYSEIAAMLYENVWEIRLAAIPVGLWLARMIMLGWKGLMDYDPIVFALRDPIGLALVGIGAFMLVQAAG